MEASRAVPQLAMRLLFDMQAVREVVSREDIPDVQQLSERRGLALGRTTAGLLSAGLRLIELLNTPEEIPFLKHLIEPEDRADADRPSGRRERGVRVGYESVSQFNRAYFGQPPLRDIKGIRDSKLVTIGAA